MSAITDPTTAAVEPFDDETPEADITYTFKTTEENKTEYISMSLNDDVQEFLIDRSIRSARWRGFSQMVNDAIIYYLNSDTQAESAGAIIEHAEWTSEQQKGAAITETLWEEIDLLVNHAHTAWDTKQELYICALYCYIGDNFPVVERR